MAIESHVRAVACPGAKIEIAEVADLTSGIDVVPSVTQGIGHRLHDLMRGRVNGCIDCLVVGIRRVRKTTGSWEEYLSDSRVRKPMKTAVARTGAGTYAGRCIDLEVAVPVTRPTIRRLCSVHFGTKV